MNKSKNVLKPWQTALFSGIIISVISVSTYYYIHEIQLKELKEEVAEQREQLQQLQAVDKEKIIAAEAKIADCKKELELLNNDQLIALHKSLPRGEAEALKTLNKVDRLLLNNKLKLLKRQRLERLLPDQDSGGAATFSTISYQYQVSGAFSDLFMYLFNLPYLQLNYNLKDVKMKRNQSGSGAATVFCSFVLQINYLEL